MNIIQRAEHKWYVQRKRHRLKNISPTILSDNCNGGIIAHDMGLRFDSPTVNLYFLPEDYLKFLGNLDRYLAAELKEVPQHSLPYPVGRLEDVPIYFMHYDSFEQAKAKWQERAQRVDKNNLFVLMTDRNGCTEEQMKRFDALPFAHKVLLTHKEHPDIQCACYIEGFEDKDEVGVLSDWKPGACQRRYLDAFDYVKFLNGESY